MRQFSKEVTLYLQYLEEKSLLEQYGHTSILTFEEWKSIKAKFEH